MKKVFLLVIISVVVLVGCDLIPRDTYYFYSLAELPDSDNTVPIDATVRYIKDSAGYTIIMSKGRSPVGFIQSEAEGEKDKTEFTLKLDGVTLTPTTSRSIDQLDGSWHVVQSFSTGHLEKGADYLLEGTTDSTLGNPSFIRTNVVRLKVR
nr:hypothetical protein [uncultured Sphaerochaeta sp.]